MYFWLTSVLQVLPSINQELSTCTQVTVAPTVHVLFVTLSEYSWCVNCFSIHWMSSNIFVLIHSVNPRMFFFFSLHSWVFSQLHSDHNSTSSQTLVSFGTRHGSQMFILAVKADCYPCSSSSFHPPQTPPCLPSPCRWLLVTHSLRLCLCVQSPACLRVNTSECGLLWSVENSMWWLAWSLVDHTTCRSGSAFTGPQTDAHGHRGTERYYDHSLMQGRWRMLRADESNGAESFLMPFLSARDSEDDEQTLSASYACVW